MNSTPTAPTREPYYQDELVTLFHGDCLEIDDWLEADVLITDPPYGLNAKLSAGKKGRSGPAGHARTHPSQAWDATLEVRDAAITLWGGGEASSGLRLAKAPRRASVRVSRGPADLGQGRAGRNG